MSKKIIHPRWCSKHQRLHKSGTRHKSCRFPYATGEVITIRQADKVYFSKLPDYKSWE